MRPARDHRRRPDRARGHAGAAEGRAARARGPGRASRRSTTCSSTPPAARAAASRARCRRCRHDATPGCSDSARCARRGGRRRRCSRRCSSRCSSSSSTSARPAKIFPSASTAFLHGQGYGAFQLPSSLLLAASFGTAALFLVEDIEGGYFDKLRATPVPRTAIVLGRLIAECVKGVLIATVIVLLGARLRDHDRERRARLRAARRADRAVGRRLRRLHAADRAQDAQRRGDELRRA